MSDNDEKTRIVRPLGPLQKSVNPEPADTKTTRKIEREDPQVQEASGSRPQNNSSPERTVLFRPGAIPSEGTTFNPLMPSTAQQDPNDPVVGWLIVVKGPGRGNAVRLGYGWNSIGRDPSQRARIDFGDLQISGINHAKLLYDPRGRKFTLTLGEGTNPIYVRNEALIAPTEIKSGDRLQVGDTELMFLALCGESFDWQDNP